MNDNPGKRSYNRIDFFYFFYKGENSSTTLAGRKAPPQYIT
jgi:hypothetical protein